MARASCQRAFLSNASARSTAATSRGPASGRTVASEGAWSFIAATVMSNAVCFSWTRLPDIARKITAPIEKMSLRASTWSGVPRACSGAM